MKRIESLVFENEFIRQLPGESGPPHLPRLTPQVAYALVNPTPVRKNEMLIWSAEAGELLDLMPPESKDGPEAQIFSGNKILPSMSPYATRYGGYQFGHWAGQLGDGRAIILGEAKGRSGKSYEIQLKGAGLTPYSRHADGRAVLRSSLREFLCSEAMFHLRVPTTRALCCVTTGEDVIRDMFYDGHPQAEPGAITTRLAPTFLRFGHYEILAQSGEHELLKKLVNFTIKKHFPHHKTGSALNYGEWFKEVCERTMNLMVDWLRVGFVHGVMNTDNMSILGLTIDYGPYGWLDVYDPGWTPNTTDFQSRRYRFGDQPSVAWWNLARLAEALSFLTDDEEAFMPGLELFSSQFTLHYLQMVANKLGLLTLKDPFDKKLAADLEELLRSTEVDPTIFYRQLARLHGQAGAGLQLLVESFYEQKLSEKIKIQFEKWIERYLNRCRQDEHSSEEIARLMNSTNPYFIPRNYLVQEALDELAHGERRRLDQLMSALKTPYEENENTQPFYKRRPEWARTRPGCSALSCSS